MKKYPAKYTCNKILDHEEPVPALVLILAMLLSLLLLEDVSNLESATSLDNSFLSSLSQQLQQKKKLSTTQKPYVYQCHLLFSRLFLRFHEIKLRKAIWKTQSQKVMGVSDRAIANCLRPCYVCMVTRLLRVRSST